VFLTARRARIGKSKSLQADFGRLIQTWAATGEMGALIDVGAVTSLTDLETLMLANESIRRCPRRRRDVAFVPRFTGRSAPELPRLPKALMSVIQRFPKDRVRLAIACRAGEFPPFLHGALEAHFGPKGSAGGTWHLSGKKMFNWLPGKITSMLMCS